MLINGSYIGDHNFTNSMTLMVSQVFRNGNYIAGCLISNK